MQFVLCGLYAALAVAILAVIFKLFSLRNWKLIGRDLETAEAMVSKGERDSSTDKWGAERLACLRQARESLNRTQHCIIEHAEHGGYYDLVRSNLDACLLHLEQCFKQDKPNHA
ncbi:MAG: hypothetical protein K2W82_13980 [Candidatus Obscuribacterales bacterium]|nr:hypothetical protein [Candidatus Obscuribacterales bacterium]